MLPQIFRLDSSVFQLTLPPEHQQKLERLLAELPQDVFFASDSLGWVYQFWQADNKDAINKSEVKIGSRELPAVTQLFTEPYMVSFLLDNALGAWWATRRLTAEDLKNASSEEELRQKAAIPGVPLEYLRFVQQADGTWTPAAGTFADWPDSLAKLKLLDPCCGSGHFLVAAFLMLVPMNGQQFTISRRYGENLVVLDAEGKPSNFLPDDLLPGIEFFSQNEIYEITQDQEGQRKLLERFLDSGHEGHDRGWKLAKHLDACILEIRDRVNELLAAGWKQVIVVTDHGWLLLPGGLPKVELPIALADNKWGRCASLKAGAACEERLYPWYWNPNHFVALADGVSCFKSGQEYTHGSGWCAYCRRQ